MMTARGKQPRQQLALSVLGFPSVETRLGTGWRVWELIFIKILIADLKSAGIQTDFYQQTGVYLLKKDESKLQELYDLATNRRQESPLIGELSFLSRQEAQEKFPDLQGFERLLYASGGARVEGALLTKTLLKASKAELVEKR